MLTVIEPAATTALTTLDRAKLSLGITDDADDEYLEMLIDAAVRLRLRLSQRGDGGRRHSHARARDASTRRFCAGRCRACRLS